MSAPTPPAGADAPPPHLLGSAHHDGSELYVPAGTPALGDVVPVRFRVPAAGTERGVWVRTLRDGEPRMVEATLDAVDDDERWYVAQVPVHNPVTQYRALLDEPGGYRWLNGRGTFAREVPDAADFRLTVHPPAPEWLRETVVYQIFPDRFARSGAVRPVPDWAEPARWDDAAIGSGPSTPRQFFGGDLGGIEAHLDHLERLGVGTVYLTPFFEGRSNHRYDASSFDHVDPLLGGDAALVSLRRALAVRGMHLIGDLTTNHTGAGHEWFRRAQADATCEEASLYLWSDADPGYVSWLEHASLPKLDYRAPALASRMIDGPESVIGHWLQPPYSLDGWRIDVANMTGRHAVDDATHAVARTIRRTMTDLNPDAVLVSEHFHDAGLDLSGDGWHANMNYSAFTRPLWTWLVDPATTLGFLSLPITIPRRGGVSVVETMREFDSAIPWAVTANQWNLLGSHDTPRVRTITGDPALVEVAAGLLFTYPGTPTIFAGDEIGLTGTNGERGRGSMPWDRPDRWDARTFAVYQALIALRRGSRALREGGLRWAVVADDAFAYLRETADERVLVLIARSSWAGTRLPRHLLAPGASPENLYGGGTLAVGPDGLHLPGDGPSVQVWRLA
ncbi:glycoside hydrolase family 13 protein [Pengzhenrongella frigida]|uniref:Glycoside hydrolase family 13 protein n=1 Tax=Pengzhenrongella frigida TaxID=1259133 RepID=A0A4V1ZHM7_9MICO|nr:glycoside hydrolase family 13 protein [Cellulomonas sp. HLT2-17]RYV52584.1 glycoside hydrolase family 13 protein [Cellulomonas sp. HLT2-17]